MPQLLSVVFVRTQELLRVGRIAVLEYNPGGRWLLSRLALCRSLAVVSILRALGNRHRLVEYAAIVLWVGLLGLTGEGAILGLRTSGSILCWHTAVTGIAPFSGRPIHHADRALPLVATAHCVLLCVLIASLLLELEAGSADATDSI